MPYNSVVSRTDAAGLIPVEYSTELANAVAAESSRVMMLGRRLRDMTVYQTTMPVMSALATAYFLDGDTDLVETSEVTWTDVNVYAKDLGVLVPIPRNVLNDSSIPIWSEVQPEMITALGVALDNAVLYGTNKPSDWPTAIVTDASSKSNSVTEGTGADLYEDILGESGVFALVEEDGFGVTGCIAPMTLRGKLRGVRDANGNPILNRDPLAQAQYVLDGVPIQFPRNGSGNTSYPLIAGDWSQLVYSMRMDMEFSVHTEGVIQDAAGNIVYNLMQQRMAALMVTMRLGFALPNPINRVNTSSSTRYPFATLVAA